MGSRPAARATGSPVVRRRHLLRPYLHAGRGRNRTARGTVDRGHPRNAVFIRPGNRPRDDGVLASAGCRLDNSGFVAVDASGQTSVPGIWAAGNVVDPRAQVLGAAGAGSNAMIAINADLILERAMAGTIPLAPARQLRMIAVAMASLRPDNMNERPRQPRTGVARGRLLLPKPTRGDTLGDRHLRDLTVG